MALLLFAVAHDVGIDAEAGVVQEDAAIDLAHIDLGRHALHRIGHGLVQIERNLQVLGEVVQRPQRQHAQPHRRAGQHRGHRVDGAVAAAGDHRGRALRHRLLSARNHLRTALRQRDIGRHASATNFSASAAASRRSSQGPLSHSR
jgi:hypothetical protein